jgi:hypothetical protein
MSNWKSASVKKAAEAVRKALKGTHHSEFVLARSLKSLRSALDDGEFVKFCMDHEYGLAVAGNTAQKFDRMIHALTVVTTETIWDRVGWDGIVKVTKITTRNERVAVCRAISKETKPIGRQILADIISERAPSYTEARGKRSSPSGISRQRALRENETLKVTMMMWIAKYPVLKRDMSDEIEEILGLEGGQLPKAG